jgi:hypothetical protein
VARGGSRPGAGRPPGAVNKLVREAVERAESGGILPLDYMLSILRDEGRSSDARMDAAKAAAPYLHAKRAPVNGDGEDVAGVTVIVSKP